MQRVPGRMDRPQLVRGLGPLRAPGLERLVHRMDRPQQGQGQVLGQQEPARRTDRWRASAWERGAPSGRRL